MLPAAATSLTSAASTMRVGGQAIQTFNSLLPTLVQETDVVVTGMPHAKRYDLYWLAVSTAFSFVRNFTVTGKMLPKGLIMLEYNAELNHVRFYCKQISTWSQVWYNLKRADPLGRLTTQIFGGPRDETKGAGWQWYAVGFGLPSSERDFGKLGWEGETILTKQPTFTSVAGQQFVSENPRPDGDEQSRGPASIAASPAVVALDPSYTYRNPEYLLFQLLSPPCNPNLTTPAPSQSQLPQNLVASPGAPPPPNVGPSTPIITQ